MKCAPETLNSSSGVLFIRTSGGPVKQELTFSKKKILGRIKNLEGCKFVNDLKFT